MHLNVGVYGYTGAGKTTCIATLLRSLSSESKLDKPNKVTERFLEEASTAADPTQKAISGLAFETDNSLNTGKLRFTLRDLPGLDLAKAADAVVNGKEPETIEEQFASSNAFLFFFNPVPPAGMDAQAHREREHLRARAMIDYVVSNRENRYLPIVFVVTMRDVWGDNIDFCQLVDRWIDDVHTELSRVYTLGLGQHYPPCLVDRHDCFTRIDGQNPEDVAGVFERIVRMRRWSNEFVASDKSRIMQVVIGAILLMTLMIGSVVALALAGSGPENFGKVLAAPSDRDIRLMREPELVERLDATEQVLAEAQNTQPYGSSFSQALKQAELLSDSLRWMPIKQSMIEKPQVVEDEDPIVISPETLTRLKKAHASVMELVRKVAQAGSDGNDRQRKQVASLYLSEVDSSKGLPASLQQAIEAFSALSRAALVEDIGESLIRARDASVNVQNTYIQLAERFATELSEAESNSRLVDSTGWNAYRNELATAYAFCQGRADEGAFELQVRLDSGVMLRSAVGSDLSSYRLWFGNVYDDLAALRSTLVLHRGSDMLNGTAFEIKDYTGSLAEANRRLGDGPTNKIAMEEPIRIQLLSAEEHRKVETSRVVLSDWQLDWHKQPSSPAPIAIPGLPGLEREDVNEAGSGFNFVVKLQERGGYELNLRLHGEYKVPQLLWDARAIANTQAAP